MFSLADKHCKAVTKKMFKELKGMMSRELKESMATIKQPISNLNKETETLKRSQKEILELKYNNWNKNSLRNLRTDS